MKTLNVPRALTGLIEFQTMFELEGGVCAHETLDKLLTEPVSSLRVDPTVDVVLERLGTTVFRESTHPEFFVNQF